MGKLKVVVYAISKNEEKYAERWMESMKEADLVVVTDTGSTDNTIAELEKYGAEVHQETIDPWRFDEARNLSLSHVPEDADICVCTDFDEVFLPGWREKLEEHWQEDTSQVNYLYNWRLLEDGSPDVQMVYFKIHARDQYVWQYPVHECLIYKGKGPEKKVFVEGVTLNHYPDQQKSRGSYLGLLEMAVKEMPVDDRMRYYLGREYMYLGRWKESCETLEAYLDLPTSTFREERCAAMRFIAKGYYKQEETLMAYDWYAKAIKECPEMRDAYIDFAQMAYELSDWEKTYEMCALALLIKSKSANFLNEGYAWDQTPYDLLSISAFNLGKIKEAFESCRIAVLLAPDDQRLVKNLIILAMKLDLSESAK